MKKFNQIFESYFNANAISTNLVSISGIMNTIMNSLRQRKLDRVGTVKSRDLLKKVRKAANKINKMKSQIGNTNRIVVEDGSSHLDNNMIVNLMTVLERLKEVRLHMIAAQRVKPKPVERLNKFKLTRGSIMDIEDLIKQIEWTLKDISHSDRGNKLDRVIRKMRYL